MCKVGNCWQAQVPVVINKRSYIHFFESYKLAKNSIIMTSGEKWRYKSIIREDVGITKVSGNQFISKILWFTKSPKSLQQSRHLLLNLLLSRSSTWSSPIKILAAISRLTIWGVDTKNSITNFWLITLKDLSLRLFTEALEKDED